MKRVAVVGIAGAGKSTFAAELGRRIGIPVTHLDVYYNDDSLDFKQNHPAFIKMMNDVEAQNEWIMDGNFGATMANRFEKADVIFWFNMSTYTALKGIYLRRYDKQGRLGMPEGWKEKVDWGFFWYVAKYNLKHHKGLELLSTTYTDKVVKFKNHKQVDSYLRELANS